MDLSIYNSGDLAIPDTIVCGGYDVGKGVKQEKICHDIKDGCGNGNKVYDFSKLRETKEEIVHYTCPFGYIPVPDGLTVDGKWLKPAGFIKGKGYVDVTNAQCDAKKDRYYLGCTKKQYSLDDMASCYAGVKTTKELARFRNTKSRLKPFTVVTEVGFCPADYKNEAAQNRFFDSYCTSSLDRAISNPNCRKYWDRRGVAYKDTKIKEICARSNNLRDPRCACINAPLKKGITPSANWAYYAPCYDSGYRTADMKFTTANCVSNVNLSELEGDNINKMYSLSLCEQRAIDKGMVIPIDFIRLGLMPSPQPIPSPNIPSNPLPNPSPSLPSNPLPIPSPNVPSNPSSLIPNPQPIPPPTVTDSFPIPPSFITSPPSNVPSNAPSNPSSSTPSSQPISSPNVPSNPSTEVNTSGDPSIPGLNDHGIGSTAGSGLNINTSTVDNAPAIIPVSNTVTSSGTASDGTPGTASDGTINTSLSSLFSFYTNKTDEEKYQFLFKVLIFIVLVVFIVSVTRLLFKKKPQPQYQQQYQQPPPQYQQQQQYQQPQFQQR